MISIRFILLLVLFTGLSSCKQKQEPTDWNTIPAEVLSTCLTVCQNYGHTRIEIRYDKPNNTYYCNCHKE